jgi:hypothetical protein
MNSITQSIEQFYPILFSRMRKISLLCLILLLTASGTLWAKVEIISYRGWKNCYQISNALSNVIIVPESGGRLLAFTYRGKNIIYQDSSQNGMSFANWQKTHFDPDGGRLDYGPIEEVSTIHDHTWMGAWKVRSPGEYSVTIYSENDSLLGLSSERTFTLDKRSAKLTTLQTATNISNRALTRHFWSRTLVLPGGEVIIKLNPKSRFKQGWGRFLFDPPGIREDERDPRVSIKDGNLHFKSQGSTYKFGADVKKGVIDYYYNGLKFQKKYKVGNLDKYDGSEHMNTIFYHSPKFLEIEPTSETVRLQPGEKMSFTEVWILSAD